MLNCENMMSKSKVNTYLIIVLLLYSSCQTKAKDDQNTIDYQTAGSVIVGSALAVVAAPVVVAGLGFTTAGIAAGSVGASMMSAMAPTAAGGIVATLQPVGAAGLGAAGTTGSGGDVGGALGKAIYLSQSLFE